MYKYRHELDVIDYDGNEQQFYLYTNSSNEISNQTDLFDVLVDLDFEMLHIVLEEVEVGDEVLQFPHCYCTGEIQKNIDASITIDMEFGDGYYLSVTNDTSAIGGITINSDTITEIGNTLYKHFLEIGGVDPETGEETYPQAFTVYTTKSSSYTLSFEGIGELWDDILLSGIPCSINRDDFNWKDSGLVEKMTHLIPWDFSYYYEEESAKGININYLMIGLTEDDKSSIGYYVNTDTFSITIGFSTDFPEWVGFKDTITEV